MAFPCSEGRACLFRPSSRCVDERLRLLFPDHDCQTARRRNQPIERSGAIGARGEYRAHYHQTRASHENPLESAFVGCLPEQTIT